MNSFHYGQFRICWFCDTVDTTYLRNGHKSTEIEFIMAAKRFECYGPLSRDRGYKNCIFCKHAKRQTLFSRLFFSFASIQLLYSLFALVHVRHFIYLPTVAGQQKNSFSLSEWIERPSQFGDTPRSIRKARSTLEYLILADWPTTCFTLWRKYIGRMHGAIF